MPVRIEVNQIKVGELGPGKGRLKLPKNDNDDDPIGVVIYGGDWDPDVVISAGSDVGHGYVKDHFTDQKKVINLEVGFPAGSLPMVGKQVLVGYRIEVIKI